MRLNLIALALRAEEAAIAVGADDGPVNRRALRLALDQLREAVDAVACNVKKEEPEDVAEPVPERAAGYETEPWRTGV